MRARHRHSLLERPHDPPPLPPHVQPRMRRIQPACKLRVPLKLLRREVEQVEPGGVRKANLVIVLECKALNRRRPCRCVHSKLGRSPTRTHAILCGLARPALGKRLTATPSAPVMVSRAGIARACACTHSREKIATRRAGLAPGLYARSLLNRSHSPRSSGRFRTAVHGCACCTSSPNGDFLIFSCGIIACEKHNRIRIGVAVALSPHGPASATSSSARCTSSAGRYYALEWLRRL